MSDQIVDVLRQLVAERGEALPDNAALLNALLSEMSASVDALIAAAQARLTTLQNAQAEGGTHARR